MNQDKNQQLDLIIGKSIKQAFSGLNCFALELSDGSGLIAEAGGQGPSVGISVVDSKSLPQPTEAICAVDWGWVSGAKIEDARLIGGRLLLLLEDRGPLNVSAGLWQGAPFLAFQPYSPRG